jgi:hypothetical protein
LQARLPVALRSDMELDRKVIIVGVFFPFTTTHGRVSVSIRRRRLLKGSQKKFRSGRLDIRCAGVPNMARQLAASSRAHSSASIRGVAELRNSMLGPWTNGRPWESHQAA